MSDYPVADIALHLCAVWGWSPTDYEAWVLAQNIVDAGDRLVFGTSTTVETLISALLTPRP